MNQQCKVCGEPAAGFHFGAFTCEGCKSFFGRSYNNLGSISECKNGGGCVINKKNRTSCKACRLRKCLMVGMSKSGSRYGRRSNWFKIHCLLQEQANNIENQQIHNHVNGHHGVLHSHSNHHPMHHHHHAGFPFHQAKPVSSLGAPSAGVPFAHQRHHHPDPPSPPPAGARPHHRVNGDGEPNAHPLHPHLLHLHRQRSEEHQQLMMMMMEDYKNRRSSSSPSVVSSPESHNSDSSTEAEKAALRLQCKGAEGEASKAAGGDFFLPFLHAGAFLPSSPFGAAAAAAVAAAAAAAAGAPHHKFLFPPLPQPHHQPSPQQHHIRSKSPPCPINNHLSTMDVYHKRFYLDSVLQSQRSPSGGSASGSSGAEEGASTNSSLLSSSSGHPRRGRDSRSASPDQEDPMDLSVNGGHAYKAVGEEGLREEEGKEREEGEGEEGGEEGIRSGEEMTGGGEEVDEGEEGGKGGGEEESEGGSEGERREEERRKRREHPLDLTTKA